MFTDFATGLMLDALDETATNGIKFWSLHSAYSLTGLNELSGGAPAYARKAAAYGAASGTPRTKVSSAGATFDIPPGSPTTVAWVGRWDAVTAGNFHGMGPAGAGPRRQFSIVDAADLTANTMDSPAHGLSAGNRVVFWASTGAGLPSPLAIGTIYWVIAAGLTADVFSVSTTSGGAAVDLTTAGDGEFQSCVPEDFTGQGQYNLTSDTLSGVSL